MPIPPTIVLSLTPMSGLVRPASPFLLEHTQGSNNQPLGPTEVSALLPPLAGPVMVSSGDVSHGAGGASSQSGVASGAMVQLGLAPILLDLPLPERGFEILRLVFQMELPKW